MVWVFGLATALGIGLSVGGASYQALASADELNRHPPPGELVDVGGHRLHLNCMEETQAEDEPTVLLEAGGGQNSLTWSSVQPQIAGFARVCSYDRAGMGWSDSGPAPRDADRVARELHSLLEQAEVSGPYVLVGHSLGGAFVRVFADRYPEEVAGMVLIDPTPVPDSDDPQLVETLLATSEAPPAFSGVLATLGVHRFVLWPEVVEDGAQRLPERARSDYRALSYRSQTLPAIRAEVDSFAETLDQVQEADIPDQAPLAVLTDELVHLQNRL